MVWRNLALRPKSWAVRSRRWLAACLGLAAVGLLSACPAWRAPALTPEEAQHALQQYWAEHNPVCQAFFVQWPVQISDHARRNRTYEAQRIAALFDAGLVDFQMDKILPSSVQKPTERDYIPVKSYRLTERGQAAYRGDSPEDARLCYAEKRLDHIVQIEPVEQAGAGQYSSLVRYVYRLDAVPEWAHHAGIQTVFPDIAREVKGSGQESTMQLMWRKGQWQVNPIALL